MMNKFQRFKEGIKNLTPLQQLNAKASGSLWGGIGLCIATVGMIYSIFKGFELRQLGFIIFVSFLAYIQFIQYIGTKQQIKLIKEAEENADVLKELENL